jgi:hypothetical protein
LPLALFAIMVLLVLALRTLGHGRPQTVARLM